MLMLLVNLYEYLHIKPLLPLIAPVVLVVLVRSDNISFQPQTLQSGVGQVELEFLGGV